jgi:hypothetical protein
VAFKGDAARKLAFWLVLTPGHSPYNCCVDIRSCGQHAVVIADLMHHALQCREPRLVDDLRLGFGAGLAVAAKVSKRDRRAICFADPFSTSDDGTGWGRRCAVQVRVCAISNISRIAGHMAIGAFVRRVALL